MSPPTSSPVCPPQAGVHSPTTAAAGSISGHPSPTPSDQPNTTRAESQTLQPGKERSYWAHRQLSETKQVVCWCDGKGKWVFMVPRSVSQLQTTLLLPGPNA